MYFIIIIIIIIIIITHWFQWRLTFKNVAGALYTVQLTETRN